MENKIINLFDGQQSFPDPKVNYAVYIQRLIEIFKDRFYETENYGDILHIAITAWNLGNLDSLIPQENQKEAFAMITDGDINSELLREMVAYKAEHFSDYADFISGYELDEEDGMPNLSVQTQKKEEYMANLFDDILEDDEDDEYDDDDDDDEYDEEEYDEEEYGENFINRSAILVKPLPPFMEWLIALYPDLPGNNITKTKIYLIHEDIYDIDGWIKKNYSKIFDLELEGWHLNENEWPQKRSYKMFKQWFQVEISASVYDLERVPVFKG